ncbi:MAG: type II toxin-antitoxin system Phd/YefM family antitoxin [Burkholderiaceae bacterium]|nr:type II toxin-antitoxin system Phd/YefM family antitoxin [Burkholderiaceae bacterium]
MIASQWQVQDAKACFSEVVRCAQHEGPQDITVQGRSVAVIVSRELYDKLTGNDRSFVEFMASSPLRGAEDLVFERDQSQTREVDL